MKKTNITGIFVVLLIAVVLIAACIQEQEPGPDTIVIKYRFYGGFVMPTHAIQELVVTKDTSTLTVYSSDGNITERFEKALTPEQFNSIVKVFIDNNFASYGDRYDEGQNYVTDVGFTDITFAANGKTAPRPSSPRVAGFARRHSRVGRGLRGRRASRPGSSRWRSSGSAGPGRTRPIARV